MRAVEGNVVSEKVPGGSLIAAVLDRELMAWSDRGGASRYLGERWSEQCTVALEEAVGSEVPVPRGRPFTLRAVVRLDENPEIAIQAGQHKLVNPDFVLYGSRDGEEHILQSADAKFAVDTIRSPQVSAAALEALLAVEGGLVGAAIEAKLGGPVGDPYRVEQGVFLSPISPLTDYFLPRVTSGPGAPVDPQEVILLPVDPVAMVTGLPMTRLIGILARIDRLPVSPRENILSAMYYFRLACACAWMWVEEHTPLLSNDPPPEVDPTGLADETSRRVRGAHTAYEVVQGWYETVERVSRSRQEVRSMAVMPVRMREIRAMVEAAGLGEDRGVLRRVRGALERRYRTRLVETVGEIPARPNRPLPAILEDVANASRGLYPELRRLAAELVEREVAEARGER